VVALANACCANAPTCDLPITKHMAEDLGCDSFSRWALRSTPIGLCQSRTNRHPSTPSLLAPTQALLAIVPSLLAPTKALLAPTKAQLAPTKAQLAPTKAQLAPTKAQLAPNPSLLAPTKALLAPTKVVMALSANQGAPQRAAQCVVGITCCSGFGRLFTF